MLNPYHCANSKILEPPVLQYITQTSLVIPKITRGKVATVKIVKLGTKLRTLGRIFWNKILQEDAG